jgi:hypothetical protein
MKQARLFWSRTGYDPESDEGSVRGDSAQPDRSGNGDALALVSRALSGLGHEVIVAHARAVRLIGESRKKDDRLDAQTLARLARIDPQLLCPVKHRSAKAQADLTVIRAGAGLVRARTALVNTARGLAKSDGERLRGCNVRNMNPEKAEGLSPELRTALEQSGSQQPLEHACQQRNRSYKP